MNYLVARVSDPSQIKALPAQKQKLYDYANKQRWAEGNDFKYIEYDETAYKENRVKFQQLVIDPLKQEEELAIVVFDKIDRFSRDCVAEERRAFTTMFRKGQIEIHFPSDNLYISKDSPASDLFRLDIGVALAAYYSSATRDNVRRRFNQLVNNKTWIGKAPVGYKNCIAGYDTDGKPVKDIRLDELKAPLILKGYELRSIGWSYGAIAKEMKKAGLLGSPRMTNGKRKSIPLSKGKWEAILQNPFYMGEMRYMGQNYPHKYPVLIEPWLWWKCQQVKGERAHARTKYSSKPYLFKRLKCAECGCTVSFDGPKGKGGNIYGRCTAYTKQHEPKWVNEKVLIEQVKDVLRSITVPPAVLPDIIAEIQKHHASEQEYYKRQKKALQDEYENLDNNIKRNFEDRGLLQDRPDLFKSIIDEASTRQREIMQELENYGDGDKAFVVGASYIVELCSKAVELFENKNTSIELKRYLLDFVLSNQSLRGQTLELELRNPFDSIVKMQKSDKWCG